MTDDSRLRLTPSADGPALHPHTMTGGLSMLAD